MSRTEIALLIYAITITCVAFFTCADYSARVAGLAEEVRLGEEREACLIHEIAIQRSHIEELYAEKGG